MRKALRKALFCCKKKQCRKLMIEHHIRKETHDEELVRHMAPAAVLKAAAHKAMCVMYALHRDYKHAATMPWQCKNCANVCQLGLTYTNSYAGRPGEHVRLTIEHAQKLTQVATSSVVIAMMHDGNCGSSPSARSLQSSHAVLCRTWPRGRAAVHSESPHM